MEDSPLSITANISGILTFAAAIVAAIYVRYNTLRNGQIELRAIEQSTNVTFTELKMINAVGLQSELGDDINDLWLPPTVDSPHDVLWLKKLAASFHATEVILIIYLDYAKGLDTFRARELLRDSRWTDIGHNIWADVLKEANEVAEKEIAWENRYTYVKRHYPRLWKYLSYLKRGLQLTLGLGTSPRMMRWYGVREKALERVRQRDILRSQILSHQVSMANYSARKSDQALQRLVRQQVNIKMQLEELTRSIKIAIEGLARPSSARDGDSTANKTLAASLG